MKKLLLMAAVAVIAFGSCSKGSAPRASLKTDLDTLSYELGVENSNGLKPYLAMRLGVDTAYMDEFFKGFMQSAMAGDSKRKAAYFAGIEIGQQIGSQYYGNINQHLYGSDSTKTISLRNLLAGFIAGVNGTEVINKEQAHREIQSRMMKEQEAYLLTQYTANKEAGEAFLAENGKKEGVVTTESGLQYKVLKAGNGPVPADTSVVEVSYEGRLIDGDVFDSSYKNNDGKPVEIHVNQMIPGWIEALQLMPEGSTWEIYIPQELAYGQREAGEKIKPFSALVFKLELVKIK